MFTSNNSVFRLFVPPEWRYLEKTILSEWINLLRARPFEDVTLGGIHYQWNNDTISPMGQSPRFIPIFGKNGWPKERETGLSVVWNSLLPNLHELYIGINRRTVDEALGTQTITHYWRVTVQNLQGHESTLWVPPEWRTLPPVKLFLWATRILICRSGVIELEKTTYMIHGDSIVPIEQTFHGIQYDVASESVKINASFVTTPFATHFDSRAFPVNNNREAHQNLTDYELFPSPIPVASPPFVGSDVDMSPGNISLIPLPEEEVSEVGQTNNPQNNPDIVAKSFFPHDPNPFTSLRAKRMRSSVNETRLNNHY